MKKIFLYIALSLLTIIEVKPIFSQNMPANRGSAICAQGKQLRSYSNSSQVLSPNSPRHKFDVVDYNLDLDIYHCYTSPYPRTFTATEIITLAIDSSLNQISLDANNTSLQVISVGINGVSFTHANNKLNITLDSNYHPGDTAQVSVNYNHLNVIDDAFYVGNGFVFTDCEPQGARKWFPCWDQPSDKATLSLKAKVPDNVRLGSNGSLVDSVTVADTTWFTWTSRDPIATYLMVISSRVNYNLDIVYWQNPNNPDEIVPFRFYYNPGENPSQMEQLILPLTDFYVESFGDHPFEKNGFATMSPQFQWGGMENQTLTSLCPGCWYSSLIAHEYAHQWFGDMITCATWADLWLNEGFATYIEALWTEESAGQQAYIDEINGNASYYLNTNPGWAISDPSWATNPPSNNVLFNYSITYMKGSCVLYMYRYVVGDSLFFSSLYDYANDTENFRYKSATIPDFIDKMNESTGQDLGWFFNEWVYQPNHPQYSNTYSFENLNNGYWNVHFRTEQVQTNNGFFQMPLEIKVSFADASDTIISVMNEFSGQAFTFEFAKRPVSLTFDPRNQIVLKEASTVTATELQPAPTLYMYEPRPNPANENVLFTFDLPSKLPVSVKVTDLAGKVVFESTGNYLAEGQQTLEANVGHLKNGTYLAILTAGNHKFTRKITVLH